MGEIVSVASVIYNLAGEASKRPDYLKSLIIGGVLNNMDSLGDVLAQGIRNSPAVRLRQFSRWASRDAEFQDKLGLTSGALSTTPDLDLILLEPEIPRGPSEVDVKIEFATIAQADITYWVLKRLAEIAPGPVPAHTFQHDAVAQTVEIVYGDAFIHDTISVADFVAGAKYLYVRYTPVEGEKPFGSRVDQPIVNLDRADPFPALDGYATDSLTSGDSPFTLRMLETRAYTYSDNRPPVTIPDQVLSSRGVTAGESHGYYHSDLSKGWGPNGATNSMYAERTFQEQHLSYTVEATLVDTIVEVTTLEGGLVETCTKYRYQESLVPHKSYQIGAQTIVVWTWKDACYFIYRQDSDLAKTVLNGLFQMAAPVSTGHYCPPIPLRFENVSITEKSIDWFIDLSFEWPVGASTWGDELWIAPSPNRLDEAIRLDHAGDGDREPTETTWTYRVTPADVGKLLEDVLRPLVQPVVQIRATEWTGDWTPLSDKPRPFLSTSPKAVALRGLEPLCKKAVKKALNTDYDHIQYQLLHNENLDDIDYAYIVFGVSLNTADNASRQYIFKFLQNLMETTVTSPDEEAEWWGRYNATLEKDAAWRADCLDAVQHGQKTPDYPKDVRFPNTPWKALELVSTHPGVSNYQSVIRWAFITETTGTGRLTYVKMHTVAGVQVPEIDPGTGLPIVLERKVGEVWLSALPDPLTRSMHEHDHFKQFNQKIEITFQETADLWRKLTITGLHFENYVYKTDFVRTLAKDALADPKDSPFIVPLHDAIMRELSAFKQAQISMASSLIVMNCAVVKQKEFYQEDWFQVIIVVVIVIISCIAAYFTGGASGLVGAELINAVLFAGAMAAVNAGVGFAMSAMFTEAFGPKYGPLVGAIVSLALSIVTMGANIGNSINAFATLSNPTTLMQLASLATSGVNAGLQFATQEKADELSRYLKDSQAQLNDLLKKYETEFGENKKIDLDLIKQYTHELTEKPEQFLKRTLLTGSDIVELTMRAVSDYTDYSLKLDLP